MSLTASALISQRRVAMQVSAGLESIKHAEQCIAFAWESDLQTARPESTHRAANPLLEAGIAFGATSRQRLL